MKPNQIVITERVVTPEMKKVMEGGHAVIVHIKPTKTGKFQVEFQQNVAQAPQTPAQMALALGLGIRTSSQPAWLTVTPENLPQFVVGTTGPAVEGHKWGVEITEYCAGDMTREGVVFEPWANEAGDIQSPKIDPSTQEILLHNNKPIYRNSTVVVIEEKSSVNHRFLETTSRIEDLNDLNEVPMG